MLDWLLALPFLFLAAAVTVETAFKPHDGQMIGLVQPLSWWLVWAGGVGGGKTVGALLRDVQHLLTWPDRASVAIIVRTYRLATDIEILLRKILNSTVGEKGYKWDGSSHRAVLNTGASIEVVQIETLPDTLKIDSRNYTGIHFEEAQEWATADVELRCMTRLRGPSDIPKMCQWTCKPGGLGHSRLMRQFMTKPPRTPFQDEAGNTLFVNPLTIDDNVENLDRDAYDRTLRTAYGVASGMYQAARYGAWEKAVAGGIFADLLSEDVYLDSNAWTPEALNQVAVGWRDILPRRRLRHFLDFTFSLDHGSARPTVGLLAGKVKGDGLIGPDGKHYCAGTWIVLDEAPVVDPHDPAKGAHWTPAQIADRMNAMLERWGAGGCSKVADDAVFSKDGHAAGSIADELRRAGLHVSPARKGSRVHGWSLLRALLFNAGLDLPGLYISHRCTYLIDEMLALPRDPRNPEDADTRAPDHASDALRYLVTAPSYEGRPVDVTGLLGLRPKRM